MKSQKKKLDLGFLSVIAIGIYFIGRCLFAWIFKR